VRNSFLGAGLGATALFGLAVTAHAGDYLGNAKQYLAKGQLKAAAIELKDAVRANPGEMEAHYLLARVELQLGKPAAAEQQAKAARAGGYDLDHTVPLLAEIYLEQHKYRELLQDFSAKTGSAERRASLLVARGYAQIALDQAPEADKSFEQAHSLAPQAPQPLLAEAKLLLAERQIPAATAKLDRALALAPKSPEIRLLKAQLLRMSGHGKKALALVDQTLSDAPEYLPARIERAEILLAQGKNDLARKDVTAVLAAQPGNVGALYLQAVLAAKGKDYQNADADLDRISGAVAILPPGYYYLKALVKYNLKDLAQAADAVQHYIARQPDDPAGKKLLALIDLTQGRPDETIAELAGLAHSGKADAGVFDLLGRAYTATGQTAQALTAYQQAVKLAPKNAALRLQLGESQMRTGNTAAAMSDLEQSLQLAPSTPAGEALAMTEMSSGQWQAAAATAAKLSQAHPNSPAARNLAGLIKLGQFDLDGAHADFAQLTKDNPDFLPAWFNLAHVDELQGKPQEAEQVLQQLFDKQPGNGLVLTHLVQLLLRNGQPDRALAAAERAHAAAPTDRGITAGLIDLYLRLGHKNKALTLAREEPGNNDVANAPLIAARARAELATGDKTGAAQSLQRLIGIFPSGIAQRRELAAVLLSAGDAAGARQAIDAAIKIAPHDPQLIADRLAIDLKTSGLAAALATAGRLQKSDPQLPTAPALPGDVYMAARQFPQAAAAYEAAFRHAPSALLAVRLAQAKAAAGRPDAAAALLRDWMSKHPGDLGVAQILAGYDIAAHRFAEARQELEQVVAKAPQDAIALNNLAWLYQQAGDPRARALAERAYLLAPNLTQTADTLGWILVRQGEAAKALDLLRRASAGAPANPAVQYHLAVALNDTGHPAEARKLLASVVKSPAKFDDKGAAEKLLATLPKS
jgi:putative PEP-CTERM system TPR-repeat lipoprotein